MSKHKRRVIALNPDEIAAIDKALTRKLATDFDMTGRQLVRYAINHVEDLFDIMEHKDNVLFDLKKSMKVIETRVDEAMEFFEDATKETRGRPKKRANAKQTPEDLMDAGRLVCEELDGIVQGNMCYYKKHEITAGGTPTSYEVGLALDALSEQTITEQYFPDKETFLAKSST